MYCIFSGLMEMKEMPSIRVMEGVAVMFGDVIGCLEVCGLLLRARLSFRNEKKRALHVLRETRCHQIFLYAWKNRTDVVNNIV